MIVANMTAKQQRFCDEYLIDLDGTKAAIRAGYSPRTASAIASENLRKPKLQQYIAGRMAEKEKQLIADQDEVLRYLTAVLRGESESEIVVVVSSGDFMTEAKRVKKAPDEKERLKAAELLGKRYGLYTDKMDVTGAVPVVITGEDELED
jgi:phage terminase small subunit